MALHKTSGRAGLGFALALSTAGLWATLPVAMKLALEQIDPLTMTWFRFVVAAVAVFVFLWARRGLVVFVGLDRRAWLLLGVAAVALTSNYVFYIFGLDHTTPANAQVLIQLAPLLMAIGGVVAFKERFTAAQWTGAAVVVTGLALFFRDQLGTAVEDADLYMLGSAFIVAAGISWAAYALAQKQLLNRMSSASVLLVIFAFATVVLLPVADLAAFGGLDQLHWIALAYCAANTLAAYGAFAQALVHWEMSKVSLVLALTPLLTVAVATAAHAVAPELFEEVRVNLLGYIGAVIAVIGSLGTSLLGPRAVARAAE